MTTVPTRAIRATSGLTKTAAMAASAPPSHGPMMGMMFITPVMRPSTAALGTPTTWNRIPQPTPMTAHCRSVPLM